MMRTFLCLCVCLAAERAVGECLVARADRLRAADLAAALPEFDALDAGTVLGFAPAFGSRRVLSPGAIEVLARGHGIRLDSRPAPLCFERASEVLREERVLEAARAALGDWNLAGEVRIEIVALSRLPIPPGVLVLQRAGLAPPPPQLRNATTETATRTAPARLWQGRVRYDGNRSVPVWARVRLTLAREAVLAAADLKAGQTIEAGQLRLDQWEIAPPEEPPLRTLEDAVGRQPRRGIRAGEPVLASALGAIVAVARGSAVEVEVRQGGARLTMSGRAESAAGIGERIVLKNPGTGRRFTATVEGPGRAAVRPGRAAVRASERGTKIESH